MNALQLAVVLLAATAVRAQVQFATLEHDVPYPGDATSGSAIGDVDGDGDLYVVVANVDQQAQANRLWLGDGRGGFALSDAMWPPNEPPATDVTLFDADGDGDLDAALSMLGGGGPQGRHRLYLNLGGGAFADATVGRLANYGLPSHAVVAADVDGDGDQDLLFADHWNCSLHLNDGAGVFTDVTPARMPQSPLYSAKAVVACDVDGDGDLDVVVAADGAGGSPQTRLFLNDGAGTFADATAARLPADADDTLAVAAADVDGDGDVDLLLGNAGQPGARNRLFRNDGAGNFGDATASLPPVVDDTRALACADLDGDGDLDVVVGNHGQNRYHANDGAGNFVDLTATLLPVEADETLEVAVLDADADGRPDLFYGNRGAPAAPVANRLLLRGGAFFAAGRRHLPFLASRSSGAAAGDIDADGDLDLVFVNFTYPGSDSQSRLYVNDGRGHFTDVTAAQLPADTDQSWAAAFADVDLDGDLDLLVTKPNVQDRLFVNDGAGTFTDATAARLPAAIDATAGLVFADLDGDGDPDLVLATNGLAPSKILRNDGTGHFTDVTATHAPPVADRSGDVAAADVDGDGDLDLVLANFSTPNALWLNDGTGHFVDATATHMPPVSTFSGSVELCDVDGDGDPDCVLAGWYQNRLYVNDGAGHFADVTTPQLPAVPGLEPRSNDVACADLDLDGDVDLVFANMRDVDLLYLNDGAGSFVQSSAALAREESNFCTAVVCCDVDGDGDADIVRANAGAFVQQNRIQLNLLRQLDAPRWLRLGQVYAIDVYERRGPQAPLHVVFPAVAFAAAQVPFPPFGTLGLDPATLQQLPAVVVPQPAGAASAALFVPNNPALLGLPVFAQALVATQGRLTNVLADVVRD